MLSSRPLPLGTDTKAHPSKTPGRSKKGRIENAIHPMTVNGKAKDVSSRTSARPATLHSQKILEGPAVSQTQLKPTTTASRAPARPLADKTPFPNRVGARFQTPVAQMPKYPMLSLVEPPTILQTTNTPDALLRPSSTRKHVRVPRSASKSFETPLNRGNHWDVSETSIVLPEPQVQDATEEDDYDEIEYMPPKAEIPYQPPFDFDLPDYKMVGKALLKLAHSYPHDDSSVPEVTVNDDAIVFESWDMLSLPELEDDDPFQVNIVHKPEKIRRVPSVLAKTSDRRALAQVGTPHDAHPRPKAPPAAKATGVVHTTKASIGQTLHGAMPTSAAITSTISGPKAKPRNLHNTATNTTPAFGVTKPDTSVRRAIQRGGRLMAATSNVDITGAPSRSVGPPKRSATTTIMPSRPTTSASIRNLIARAPSAAAVRRPMTSATSYKPASASSYLRSGTHTHIAGSTKRPGAKEATSENERIILQADMVLDYDFKFDV